MNVRLAIASDLHVHTDVPSSSNSPSFQSTQPCGQAILQDPLASLHQLIESDSLKADVLLCPGDLGDKANPTATSYAWRALHDLRVALCADVLLASAGNHDIDSRHVYNGFDAKGTLMALSPSFPLENESLCDKFWARNFCIYEFTDNIRFVLINSCGYHGYTTRDNTDEYLHGRVADSTRSYLMNALASLKEKPLTVFVTHHHPIKNDLIQEDDYSEMQGGHILLNEIHNMTSTNALFIHGHKHTPRIFYAPGGAAPPLVFSAGSVAAKPIPSSGPRWRNQFYIITIPVEELERLGLGVVGTVEAWDWSFGTGWEIAGAGSAIPYGAGFGCHDNPQHLARLIRDYVKAAEGSGYVEWAALKAKFPHLVYMLPSDLLFIKRALERDGMRVLPAGADILHQVAMK